MWAPSYFAQNYFAARYFPPLLILLDAGTLIVVPSDAVFDDRLVVVAAIFDPLVPSNGVFCTEEQLQGCLQIREGCEALFDSTHVLKGVMQQAQDVMATMQIDVPTNGIWPITETQDAVKQTEVAADGIGEL